MSGPPPTHVPQQLPRPQVSPLPQFTTLATHINMLPHPHLHLSRQQSPRTSPSHQLAAQTDYTYMDLRLHRGLGLQQRPQVPTWPLVTSPIIGFLPGGPSQEMTPSSLRSSIAGQIQGDLPAGRQRSGLQSPVPKPQAHAIGNDSLWTSALSLTCHHQHIFSSASVHKACTSLFFFCLSHYSNTYTIINHYGGIWPNSVRQGQPG